MNCNVDEMLAMDQDNLSVNLSALLKRIASPWKPQKYNLNMKIDGVSNFTF